MSIFSSILSKIFPASHPAVVASAPVTGAASPTAAATGAAANSAAPAAATLPPVDVEQVLTGLASKHAEKLNWQSSIVDLLKLLGLDSSFASRKALAQELHYTGDTGDSASMNIWLHKQVMSQLAANGGKVPDSLKH